MCDVSDKQCPMQTAKRMPSCCSCKLVPRVSLLHVPFEVGYDYVERADLSNGIEIQKEN